MKTSFFRALSFCACLTVASAFADDADLLNGKWLTKKTDESGQSHTQTIEIKKDKFNFQISGADNEGLFYATGDVKLQKLGPFSSIKFTNIRGGISAGKRAEMYYELVSVFSLYSEYS